MNTRSVGGTYSSPSLFLFLQRSAYPVAFTGKHGGQLMGGPLHTSLFAQGFIGKIDDDVAHGWSCRHSIHRGMTFSG